MYHEGFIDIVKIVFLYKLQGGLLIRVIFYWFKGLPGSWKKFNLNYISKLLDISMQSD